MMTPIRQRLQHMAHCVSMRHISGIDVSVWALTLFILGGAWGLWRVLPLVEPARWTVLVSGIGLGWCLADLWVHYVRLLRSRRPPYTIARIKPVAQPDREACD